jgi:hypothetical protein
MAVERPSDAEGLEERNTRLREKREIGNINAWRAVRVGLATFPLVRARQLRGHPLDERVKAFPFPGREMPGTDSAEQRANQRGLLGREGVSRPRIVVGG